MRYGAKNAENITIRYDQTNNIIERFLFDLKTSKQTTFWLESCNVCASACAIEAVGGLFKTKLPIVNNKEVFGYDDLLFFFLYSTEGRSRLPELKDGVAENEVPSNLVFAINECSTAKATLITLDQKDICSKMKLSLKKGCAIVLSYLTDYNTGHYICIVQYDEDRKVFIGYDSWSDNKHNKNGGIREEYSDDFITLRSRPRFIEVSL